MNAIPLTELKPLASALTRTITQAGAGGGGLYPIDEAGGVAPVFAYGAVKLTSAYSGPALRVVRTSDSATLDVGFVGTALDTAALDAFLAGAIGRVDIWYDQSGNAHHATQTTAGSRPYIDIVEIGDVRAVQFSGGFMSVPAGVSISRQAGHVFTVAEFQSSNNNSQGLWQLGAGATQVTFLSNVVAGGLRHLRLFPNNNNATFKPQTRPLIYEAEMATTRSLFAQGEEIKSEAQATAVTLTGGFIGNTDMDANYKGYFYAGCHIGYGRVLSAGERTALRDALNTVFGITETATNLVMFEGDSITAGSDSNASYGYPKMAQRELSEPARVYASASGGTRISGELTLYASQVGLIMDAHPTYNRVVFLHMGTNDLTTDLRTAAQIYADIQTFAGYVRADGGKIIVSTILPNQSWDATKQTTRNDLNTLIRTNWASFADGLADFAADATMGPQAAASNNTLYPDGLHPSRLGHSYLAPIAAAAINALL